MHEKTFLSVDQVYGDHTCSVKQQSYISPHFSLLFLAFPDQKEHSNMLNDQMSPAPQLHQLAPPWEIGALFLASLFQILSFFRLALYIYMACEVHHAHL